MRECLPSLCAALWLISGGGKDSLTNRSDRPVTNNDFRQMQRNAAERLKLGGARRQQHRRSGGEPRLEIAMGAGGFGQRIGLVDRDLDLAAAHHVKQLVGG